MTGNQNNAIAKFNEALVYARKTSDHITMALAYSQLSNIFRMNGAYQQAIEFIFKSKEQYELAGFKEGVAWIAYSIGRIYSTMNLYEEAQKEFLEALDLYENLSPSYNSLTGEAICHDELGLTFLELGDTEKARLHNMQARSIYTELGSDFGMSNACKYKARIEYRSGDYETALLFLDQSRRLKKSISDVLGFPGVYLLYGQIHSDMDNYQAAIDSLNVGLNYAVQNSQKSRIILISEKLADIYGELEDYDQAYAYRTNQLAINDSISHAKATRAMTQLEAIYDLEAREKKIRELEQENMVTEISLEREVTVRNLLLIILTMIIVFTFFLLKLFSSNRQVNITLKKNQLELQELNATKDKFTSIIAHDLKSPFNSLIGFSGLLENASKKKDLEKVSEYAKHIKDVSVQTYKLLENLLEWSRSQTGKISFEPKAMDIKVSIKNVVDLMYPVAKRKEVNIDIDAETIPVLVDENMIHTILQNLLSNAIKYSYHKGNITISAKEKEGMLLLSVKDEGMGITEDKRSKLFQLDESLSEPGTDGERGTGLGLILCKEFVERHRGKIDVESELGKGSTFIIYLPL
jgi:signal transduction histidine kinase